MVDSANPSSVPATQANTPRRRLIIDKSKKLTFSAALLYMNTLDKNDPDQLAEYHDLVELMLEKLIEVCNLSGYPIGKVETTG